MFGELTKLRELGRLLKKRRYLEALALARDPAIREHRKAVVGAEKAREALLSVAQEQRDRGEGAEALEIVCAVLRDGEDPEARRLEEELRSAVAGSEAPEDKPEQDDETLMWPPRQAPVERARGGPRAPGEPAGLRPVTFRSADQVPGRGAFARGLPFVLRVEERGDWFVHPGQSVLIGNATGHVADLPVLAAVGTRHARIERIGDGVDARYRVVPIPGRKVTRNRQKIGDLAVLEDGDVLGLGASLTVVFRQPVPGSATAVLELGGDFTVHGCRRVLLFSESGRTGAVVLGPGPQAHVSLSPDGERVEVLRGESGATAGLLLARCPRGVAVADDEERPQVRVQPGVPIRAGGLGFFVDPV